MTPLKSLFNNRPVRSDIAAGLTTTVMVIPQSMAYAMLAGIPAEHGLYAAVIAPVVYAMFGRSPHVGVGPAAIDSLLVFAAVSAIASPGSPEFVSAAISMAFAVGISQIVFSLVGLHRLAKLFSSSVTSGFISGGALVIAASQLSTLLGISRSPEATTQAALWHAATQLGEAQLAPMGIGVGTIASLWLMRRFASRLPRALIVCVGGGLLSYGLSKVEFARVGEVPHGLPMPQFPELTQLPALLPAVLALALVSFAETYSVAKHLKKKAPSFTKSITSKREMLAIGLANIGSSLFRGFSVAGGLSRSAVNFEAGAKSRWAGALTGLAVAVCLLLLTDALYWIPKATLAGIIMFSVVKLIDVRAFVKAFREMRRADLFIMSITAFVTASISVVAGLGTGLALSAIHMWHQSRKSA